MNVPADTSSDGDLLFEDTVEDDNNTLPDLQECFDDEDEDEDACLTVEEFDWNQALDDANHNASYFHFILLPEAVIDSFW
jgi:hypothetical protein